MSQQNLLLIRKSVILVTALCTVTLYYLFDPAKYYWGPPCLMHSATGWLCWGCGGQRAFHHLLHGHFHTALQLNALVFPVTLLLSYMAYSEFFKNTPSYIAIRKKGVVIVAILVLLGFTILRNIWLQ
jgi:fatty acid desaturase